MNNPVEPDEQKPVSIKVTRLQAKLEKFRFIHNSPLGKRWQAYKSKLGTTEQGKRKLKLINATHAFVWLALFIWFKMFGYDFLFPVDYNLTDQQKSEGYSRTLTPSIRNPHPEDVYYRFYKDNELDLPSCKASSDWCVFAIPTQQNCSEIAMQFKTYTSKENSDALEEIDVSVKSEFGLPFDLGQRVTLNVASKDPKAELGQVDHIYCRG